MNSEQTTESTLPTATSAVKLVADSGQAAPLDTEYRQLLEYFKSRSVSAERLYFTSQTYAVRILELFLLTGIVALGLTLIRNFGAVGSLIIFLIASLFSMLAGLLIMDANRVRFWNQMLWGIVVPVAAVIGDPFVFGTFEKAVPVSLEDYCAGTYFVLGYSMLLLALSWFLKPTSFPWANTLLAGQLQGGAVVMFFVGLMLIPITLVGLFSLFGLLGLVPFIAGGVFFRTSSMHHRWARSHSEAKMRSLFIFGFLIVLLAFVGFTALGAEVFGD